ncbi:class I SAM-dependent methyltransferase [Hymenobacter elongatus]|uniref:Uncharacterized protein n=1 Tax=Hymenobacter elongatus TaxID=877208 RepID=A0A4Z0PRV9_9BACT|nr:hypothetical protein [Hymenobacter elongatus]TGE18371.1 hypothetical protein E5J99_05580 [Hymenobacter elongatus]
MLPRLVKDGRRFDFIVIDGNHTLDGVLVDFSYPDLLLNDGHYILFHGRFYSRPGRQAASVRQ